MAYITTQQFIDAFGERELSELTGDEAQIFARAADDADALINGYVATRYKLPLASTPPLVVAWALDIARFRLWGQRAPDEVRARYDDAVAALKDLARGLIALPPDAAGTPQPASFAYGAFGAERVFTADTLAGF